MSTTQNTSFSPHCAVCGFDNPPGMRFCGNCGTRLPEIQPTEVEPAAVRPPAAQVGPMIGADLLARFRQAGLEAAGQRRNVTVLFVDLSGYTSLAEQMDSEELYELVRQFVTLLANDVYKYEGMVDKFTGDGLMALFGAPVAHENNAELAVRAALDMQADVALFSNQLKHRLDAGLLVHIGLHTGTVVVGGIGSDMLMNYTAIGDTVNLAQRLEDAASPGTILVSETVYAQTHMLFNFNPEPTLQLKGIRRPVKAYRILGIKAAPGLVRGIEGLHAPMVGRETELARLQASLARLLEKKRGSFSMIVGEAGLGKSRLTRELKALCNQEQVTILEGQSLTYRRTVPYWIFLELLRDLFGILPDSAPEATSANLCTRISNLLPERAGAILPYLEHLLSLPASDPSSSERIRLLEAGQLRQQIFLAVRNFLVAEAQRQPLLLILEDLHWADETSLELLLFVLETLPEAPIAIVAISRPFQDGGLSRIVEWAAQHLGEVYHAIPLRTLSVEQSGQLLCQLLEDMQLPDWLHDQILERAAGIPFYLEELLRVLIDRGILTRQTGQWRVAQGVDLSSLGVPQSLEGLILARFDRLQPVARRLLQVASVVGRQFSYPVLKAVLGDVQKDQVEMAIDHLLGREFIVSQADSPYSEYAFRHVLMSDAIYKTLLKREQQELHGQIGAAIEQVFASRIEGQVEILARHYSWSNRHDRALYYLLLAGRKASRNYANEQARQHYEQSLEILPQVKPDLNQVLEVYTGLGDVLVFIGEYAAARENFEKALNLLSGKTSPDDDPGALAGERSTLYRKIGTTYERQGDYDQAMNFLSAAQKTLDDFSLSMPVERAEILNDAGWISLRRGELNIAEKDLAQALTLSENSNRYDVEASIYNRLAGVYFQKGDLDQASYYLRKSLVLREEMGDTAAVARSYSNLGLLTWRRGEWDQALAYFKRGSELQSALGDVEGTIQLNTNIGLLLTDKGELEEAGQHLEMSLRSAIKIGHSFLEGMAYHHLSRLWLAAQEWDKALDYSNRALQVFSEIKTQENLAELYASLGEAWLGLEDMENARLAGEMAMSLLPQTSEAEIQPPLAERGRALRLLGNLARLTGDWHAAGSALKDSMAQFTLLGDQLELARTLIALAQLAKQRGDRTGFRLHLNEARLILGQLGAKLDLKMVTELTQARD